jgi:hypothetical protein
MHLDFRQHFLRGGKVLTLESTVIKYGLSHLYVFTTQFSLGGTDWMYSTFKITTNCGLGN